MTHVELLRDTLVILAAIVVGLGGSARLVRLVTNDDFPPIVWLKVRWNILTNDGPWAKLVECLWCFAPYVVAVNLAWALLSDMHWTWWVFNGWLSASYATSWLVYHDED